MKFNPQFSPTIVEYVKDRDQVMLAYPDTTKLDDFYRKYKSVFTDEFILKTRYYTRSKEFKLMTIENMIASWSEAPLWFKEKVRQAQEARKK